MDKNSGIGLTIIAALLLVYFYWFSPKPQPVAETQTPQLTQQDTSKKQDIVTIPQVADSTLVAKYGFLSPYIKGEEKTTQIETKDLKITFSSKGGHISKLELQNYKPYYPGPLNLIDPDFNEEHLLTQVGGEPIDLYALYYESSVVKQDSNTVVTFHIAVADGGEITQEYVIPPSGYEIGYTLTVPNAPEYFKSDNIQHVWDVHMQPYEKNLQDTRRYSTITYFTTSDDFEQLSPTSNSQELETVSGSIKWIAIKDKFFLTSIISDNYFAGGTLETDVFASDTTVVKHAITKLNIPTKQLSGGAHFKFYFGPNDYKAIGKVAPDFDSNVSFGWPPMKWINRYFILPVFHFLDNSIANIGLVIIILVLIMKLVLLPLSYRSYLSMAKMRLLKPELDELKEKNGGDTSKMQQDQMKLYQQAGVNPLSGCIPVVLQMPIILAMYYLFPNSIELRQESFLWATDLSTYDSIAHLPFNIPFYGNHVSLFTLLMTASSMISAWQNSQISSVTGPMKSMQYVMPLIFLFLLNSFPAGLSFYYLVSNLITFGQQAIIRRFVNEDKIIAIMEDNKRKNAAGGGKKSKFMAKLEGAMKASEETRKKNKR